MNILTEQLNLWQTVVVINMMIVIWKALDGEQ